jgi:hypothetical protein
MKHFYLTTLVLFSFLFSFSSPINKVIVNKGKWNSSKTWSLNRVPENGDTVLIPASYSLVIDNNVKMTAENLYVRVLGNVHFAVGKLDIGYNSIVELAANATITTKQENPSDKIEMGNILKYSGSQGTITGPLVLKNGPTVTLPVKFIGYTVARSNNGTSIQWSTSEEVNANMYVVERSEDGSTWKSIAYVAAAGNSNEVNSYSFTDKADLSKATYYRVKQVDNDGHFVYTSIKSVKVFSETNQDVRISSSSSNVVVEFNKQIKGNVVVRLVSLSGQVVNQKTFNQPEGLIILDKASFKGSYVVSVTNGHDVKIAKQVIL